jgi:hypothetical protein
MEHSQKNLNEWFPPKMQNVACPNTFNSLANLGDEETINFPYENFAMKLVSWNV